MPSGAVKLRFSVHSKSLVIYFVISYSFHHHHLNASFALRLTFANKFVTWQKYPSMYNPSSLQMQCQCVQNWYCCSKLGMNALSGAEGEEVGCPGHVWILGA